MTSSTPPRSSTPVRLIALGVVASLILFLTGALFAATANAETEAKKVFVCKYVGTPGEDERLQTGDNPVSVSVNAVASPEVGSVFSDQQGRSYVIAVDDGGDEAEPVCPDTPPGDNGDGNGDDGNGDDAKDDENGDDGNGDENGDDAKDEDDKADENGTATDTQKPVAAPTGLRSTQVTGLASLFAIAAALLGAAALVVRGARH